MIISCLSIRRILHRIALAAGGAIVLAHIYVLLLGIIPSPRTWTMTGRVIAGETLQYDIVKIEDVSPFLISAIIAAEDARFCSHIGIDRDAIEKAIEHNKKGGRRRGGSTITQQTAKNLFFWNGGGMARKAGEAYAALLIDVLWSKTRIMEHYINIAEWGDGIFGAEAAAQARFGKPSSALTSYEAALLASVLPSPNKWRLDPASDYVTGRARTINARLKVTVREGYADCVLSKHPAYDDKDFRVAPPIQKPTADKTEDNKAEPKQNYEEATPLGTPAIISLEDILLQSESALEAASKDMTATPGAPRDIRPPALEMPLTEKTNETTANQLQKPESDTQSDRGMSTDTDE